MVADGEHMIIESEVMIIGCNCSTHCIGGDNHHGGDYANGDPDAGGCGSTGCGDGVGDHYSGADGGVD